MTKFSNDFNIEDLFPDNLVEGFQDKLWRPLNSKNVIFTLYGRNALFLGMQKIANVSKKREVLVPSYSCGDEIRAITSTGLSIRSYRVMANTQVDFEDLKSRITEKTVAVLVTHYFGFAQMMIEDIKVFCQSKGVYLIEDCAHSCGTTYNGRPLGVWGDLAVFSLRKSFDILHGGALVINNINLSVSDISKPPTQVVDLDMFNYLGFKNGYIQHGTPISKYLKSTTDTQDVHGARHSKIGGYLLGISNTAKFMLQYVAKNDLEERNKIFSFYLDFFSRNTNTAIRPLFESIDIDTRPLFFPVLVDDSEEVCQYLRGKNIFITQPFWSHIHDMINLENYKEAIDLKKNIIILPLIHKIPESDLMVLISEISMLNKKNEK
jgi:dTDP-4-amino-4,6-dideoxygalactose transaminase